MFPQKLLQNLFPKALLLELELIFEFLFHYF
nr:MAG TPA: hypothetical protein [Bacteriophage sp.]